MTVLQLGLFAFAAWTGGIGCYWLVLAFYNRVSWPVILTVAVATLILGLFVLSQLLWAS